MKRRPPPTHGLRFDWIDGVILAGGALLAGALALVDASLALIPAFALGHFLLFCNVFRVAQRLEYLWAALLLVNVVAWWATVGISPAGIMLSQLPVTVAVIVVEMRSARYHGVGSRAVGGKDGWD